MYDDRVCAVAVGGGAVVAEEHRADHCGEQKSRTFTPRSKVA